MIEIEIYSAILLTIVALMFGHSYYKYFKKYHFIIKTRFLFLNKGIIKFKDFNKIKLPLIEVKVAGIKTYMILDTGANNNLIDNSFVERLKECIDIKEEPGSDVRSIAGVTKTTTCDIPFSIDSHKFTSSFLIGDLTSVADSVFNTTGKRMTGILSSEFMEENAISLDLINKVMFIKL